MDEDNISINDKALEAISAGQLLSYEEFVDQQSQKDKEEKIRHSNQGYYSPTLDYKNYLEAELKKLFPGCMPWFEKP
ncbi:hypothetical protein KTQ42_01415|uniref:hypothetical protein n=1 Tax=Noviherbaspirillum sp. L7-7A TaxID=2850560 RepID=UPI001C2C2854|nr:hypothetical protein [Noviherbaspirillum sp. L7-7A]MBV0877961.1 hypothetical protein [Noviherbaspirillum sp. L7-7A]